MIFFATGLLTLLAFSNAGGDHIKGGGHIKGVDHIKGGGVLPSGTKTVPQAIVQEEAIPSPYSFNIKTGAAYGTKVTREEVGDSEGRVKGTYTVSSPRGATRVVQYHADDTGFHANIKTSEPNIKTHSPSNAQIEAIPIKGRSASGVKTVQVPDELVGKIHRTAELPQVATVPVAQSPVIQATDAADPTRIKNIKTVKAIKSVVASGFNIKGSQIREPTARPDVKETVVAAIKSAPVLVSQQNIKTVIKKSDPSKIHLTQQRFSPLDVSVTAKGGSDVFAEGIQAAPFTDRAKEIIVYEDGTTVEVQGSSILGQDLSTFTGQDSFVNQNPQISYSQRERGGSETIFRAGSIDEKVKPVQAAPKAPTSTEIFPNPQRTAGTLSQLGISSDIVNLNRQLQRQSEEELKRTLAGIVDVDTNLQSASLSDKELADIARRIGSGAIAAEAPAPQQRGLYQVQGIKPAVSPQRIPLAPRSQIVGAGIDQRFKYTAGRVTAGGIQGGTRRVTSGQIRGSSTLGQGENVFILGNAPGAMGTLRTGSQGIPKPKPKVSPQALPRPQITATQALPQPGIGADIAELNRQLQMQSEEELKRTLAGIVNVDANIQGASLSEKELADISRRIGSGAPAPVAPAPQQRRPDQIQRIKPQRIPVAPRPQVVGTGIDQKFKYTAGRVTAGGIQGGRVTAGQIRGSSAVGQGENVFILGNAPGAVGTLRTGSQGIPKPKPKVSPQALPKPQITATQVLPQTGLGADIAELNRQLQMQSEEELKRTLAGIVNVDSNIQGASLSEKELADISRRIGSGAPAPVTPAPQQRRPDQIQRIKPQRIPVAPRPQVVGTGIDQKFKYTAGRVTAGGIQGGRVTAGQIRGSSAVGQGGNVFILGNAPGAVGTLRTGSQGIPKPKPKVSPQALPKPQITATQVLPQPGLGADIAELNRQLQMQSEEELKRTLAGIVNVDANIQGASLSEKELADISRRIGSGAPAPVAPAPQQRRPDQIQRIKPQRIPVAPRPQVVGTGIDQKFKYTAGRVTAGGIQGGRVTAGQIRGSSAVGQGENVFILGNAPGAVGTLRTGSQGIPKPKPKVSPQALPKPQITATQVLPQTGLGADIAELNRQLQMQSEEELKRTLAGIVNVDSNIQGASLSEKELADISRRIGSGAPAPVTPAPQQRRPDQIQRIKPQRIPVAPRPQVVGTGIDQKFKYTAGRVTAGGIQGGRVTAGQIRGSSAVGQGENVFILGNAPGAVGTLRTGSQGIPKPKPKVSPQALPKPQITTTQVLPQTGLGADIAELNRQLQMQSEEELKRTLAGIVNVDSNIQGASLSEKELADISRRIGSGAPAPVTPAPQQRRPDQIQRIKPQRIPVAPRPQVVGTGIDQKFEYTAGRVTAGGIQRGRVTAGQIRGSSTVGQGEKVFILGNAPGAVGTLRTGSQGIPKPKPKVSPQALPKPQITATQVLPQPGLGADIAELNRQLQMQNEEELKRTLAGIVNVDANIQGASLSEKELADISRRIGSGAPAPVAPAPQQRRPGQIQRIKPQRIPVAPRPQVVGTGIDQKFKYTAGRVTAGGIQGGRVTAGQIRGSSAVGQGENVFILGNALGAVGTLRTGSQGIPKPKPKVSPQALPKPQITATQVLPQPGLGADIAELNRQLQMQSEEELKRTLAGIVNVDANIQGASLSEKELADISRRIGSGAPAPVAAAPQQRRPDQIQRIKPQRIPVAPRPQVLGTGIDQKFKYTAGRVTAGGIQGGRVTAGQISGSSAAGQLPQSGLSDEVMQINRLLMQKQNENELRQMFSGVLSPDLAVDKISLSAEDLKDISRRFEADTNEPVLLSTPLSSPNQASSGRLGSQGIASSSLTRTSSDALRQRFGSGEMKVTDEGKRGNLRVISGNQQLNSKALGVAVTAQFAKDSQDRIETPIEIQQNVEPNFPAVSTIKIAGNKITQVKESSNKFSPVEQSKLAQSILVPNVPVSQTFQSAANNDDVKQLQIKVDDVIEQSRLPKADTVKQISNRPPVQSKLALESFSQKYLQEKIPVTIPGYVPPPSFMSPFNYRVPHIRTPIMQQQERLDQILV